MFKTTGTIDKSFFDEIKSFVVPIKSKIILFVIIVFLALLLIASVVLKDYSNIRLLVFLIFLLLLEYILIRNRTIKMNLKRMIETTGSSSVDYTVYFDENGVHVENHSTSAKGTMAYDSFVRLAKCCSYYVLFTKTHQFVPIFINCFDATQKDDLLLYLKTHIPKLKC